MPTPPASPTAPPPGSPPASLPDGLTIATPDVDDDADLGSWIDCFGTVFASPRSTAEFRDSRREVFRSQRLTGVRDGGRWVATFRTWQVPLSVPGTATVPCELVSTVAVAPTHRRRGLLTSLMTESLRHAASSGAAVASLIASETAIYGRYGFGVGVEAVELSVDTRRARSWLSPAPSVPGSIRLSDDDELLAVGPAVYETARRRVPGAPPRSDAQWQAFLDRLPHPQAKPDAPRQVAVHVGPDGAVDGYVRLQLTERWDSWNPAFTARIEDLAAADPAVRAALWRFCVDLDLVTSIEAEDRPSGELLPELLLDRRAARLANRHDMYWLRVLDPAAALGGRRWAAPVDVVLDVDDGLGHAAGRWRIRAGEDGSAEVGPTGQPADLSLDAAGLAPILTGGVDLVRLGEAGRVREHAPGALARLAAAARASSPGAVTLQGF